MDATPPTTHTQPRHRGAQANVHTRSPLFDAMAVQRYPQPPSRRLPALYRHPYRAPALPIHGAYDHAVKVANRHVVGLDLQGAAVVGWMLAVGAAWGEVRRGRRGARRCARAQRMCGCERVGQGTARAALPFASAPDPLPDPRAVIPGPGGTLPRVARLITPLSTGFHTMLRQAGPTVSHAPQAAFAWACT